MAKPKKELTVKEMASMGGKARALSLTGEQRREISSKGAHAFWAKRRAEPRRDTSNYQASERAVQILAQLLNRTIPNVDIAEMAGMSQSYVCRILRGNRASPSVRFTKNLRHSWQLPSIDDVVWIFDEYVRRREQQHSNMPKSVLDKQEAIT